MRSYIPHDTTAILNLQYVQVHALYHHVMVSEIVDPASINYETFMCNSANISNQTKDLICIIILHAKSFKLLTAIMGLKSVHNLLA